MTVGDGLAVLGICLALAIILVAAAWVRVVDTRERLRALDRLTPATRKRVS